MKDDYCINHIDGEDTMNNEIREAHYNVPVELKPRNQFDAGISDDGALERSLNFEMLGSAASPFTNGKLVSSVFGGIERVLFTIPQYALQQDYRQAYEHLFASLPAATRFVILCSGRRNHRVAVENLLDEAGVKSRAEIVETNYPINFSIWAEDAYVVVQDDGQGAPTLVEPANFTRYDDGFIADIVSAQSDVGVHSVPLYYQGGNVLIGDDYWLIGSDYPAKATKLGLLQPNAGESDRDAAIRRYGEELDSSRRMIILGTRAPVPQAVTRQIDIGGDPWTELLYYGTGLHQPLFHIDMFVTLAGRDDEGKPIALVGDPQMAANILGESTSSLMMIPYYDDIANRLTSEGFSVVRNPLPLTYVDDREEATRLWYFATANNALVEITDSSKRVWLPSYGYGTQQHLQATDNKNKRIWEDLGFTVTMLKDFNPFASNLGAVHCICKYLQRA